MNRRKGFAGWYFKQQKGDVSLSLIPGYSEEGAFLQVVTKEKSHWIPFADGRFGKGAVLQLDHCFFSPKGVFLNLSSPELELLGKLRYYEHRPLVSDIMGTFRFLPMECRHHVISMNHRIEGQVSMNGEVWDFCGGRGYIEGDSGNSFPKWYTWIQCNDFLEDCALLVSVAKIPFAGCFFTGCICAILFGNREYRLATYRGAKVKACLPGYLELEQGTLRFQVEFDMGKGQCLAAPRQGRMVRKIDESLSAYARFRLMDGKKLVFDQTSPHASFEYVPEC